MDVRQQISIPQKEVENIIKEHLEEKNFKVKDGSLGRDGSYFCTLYSDEELWIERVGEVLQKAPVDVFNFKNQPKLFEIFNDSMVYRKVMDLLQEKLPSYPDSEDLLKFKSENVLWHALYNEPNAISKKEEDFLIKEFKKLEIHIHKRKDV
ncbi:MAG: hypothetical protein PHC89_00290 [Candidatus Pacebacteria bacterium]|nr:hypothetical protein [Candidatus Paceibacterota bacterium]